MIKKRTASYEDAREVLDQHFSNTGKTPSIRQLKSACGGAGSTETYQAYLNRWLHERQEETGIRATLLAMKSHIEASSKMLSTLVDQAGRQLAMCPVVPMCDGNESESAEVGQSSDDEEVAAPDQGHANPVAPPSRPKEGPTEAQLSGAVDGSIPRFQDRNEIGEHDGAHALDGARALASHRSGSEAEGEAVSSSPVPQNAPSRSETSSQQAALAFGSNAPAAREGAPTGDRRDA